MKKSLNKSEIERFSRQIILKNIGSAGQEKIKKAKVIIIGAGGLGCPVAEFLTRAGVGEIGIIDNDVLIYQTFIVKASMTSTTLNVQKFNQLKKN